MKTRTFLNKLSIGVIAFCSAIVMGCQSGLTYEEAPESAYSEVGITGFVLRSRQLFENQIYAINWEKWVDNYIQTVQIGSTGSLTWTNNTGSSFTLQDGSVIENGQTVTVTGSITTEEDSEAPEGKLYVLNVYATDYATYQTANKGYLFDASKFSGDFQLIDADNNRSEKVRLPVRKTEVIGELNLANVYNCVVERVDGAPELGKPNDLSNRPRYLVKNICYRPAGVEQYTRLCEVRIIYLPSK